MAMVDESVNPGAYSIGTLGAILSAIGILTSGPLALPVVALVHPQPLWDSPELFVENFHRIQTVPFFFAYLLAAGGILMLVSVYLLSKERAASLAALIFMSIGAAFAFLNYVAQTTFIPAIVNNYTTEFNPIISIFSMSNPIALSWAIEMWGYGFMGLGTWLAAGFFGASPLERAARVLFILNGIVSVLGALATAIDLSGVFSIFGLVGYGAWNVLYLALAVVFYRVLQKRRVGERT
ncbi:MAG: hypothetical protein OER90_19405 [Gemmatimonadota bacterium]|nr:hypothetical protein [Gemmatimonadota bacterium]